MPIQQCAITVDATQRELEAHGSPMWPLSCYNDDLAAAPVPWHWHPEWEIITVIEGTVLLTAGTERYTATPGQSLFVGAEMLHGCRPTAPGPCRIHSVVFLPKLVGGSRDSILWQKYLSPLEERLAPDGLFFDGSSPWHREIPAAISAIHRLSAKEPLGFEFSVRAQLSGLILLLQHHPAMDFTPSGKHLRDAARIKAMLALVHSHYGEALKVSDIAAAASVSTSECLRCFRSTVGMTPVEYLRQYRLEQAARLLRTTDESIAGIGFQCGFQDMSYFADCFQRQFGRTPSRYRREQSPISQ